jgi:spore maturation protein CgeB
MTIVVLGLSITSSWGNGHATTYRALLGGLADRGHDVQFLERDVEWYAGNRDLPASSRWSTSLYDSVEALHEWAPVVRDADAVIVGSYVPEGAKVIDWVLDTAEEVVAFYDIDTPVTLDRLERGTCEYLRADQIGRFDLYLSFSGGATLSRLERRYGAQRARALYCAVDATRYVPSGEPVRWHLGYLGTFSPDRQAALDMRLVEPARRWDSGRFVVAGPQFPDECRWPSNVERIEHLAPPLHPRFYCAQRFTLNVTRAAMVDAGHSPSVRLFEAAACGTPIISDAWSGLEDFFEPGREILVAQSADEMLAYLREWSERDRRAVAERARARVLGAHTAVHRAAELEAHLDDARC